MNSDYFPIQHSPIILSNRITPYSPRYEINLHTCARAHTHTKVKLSHRCHEGTPRSIHIAPLRLNPVTIWSWVVPIYVEAGWAPELACTDFEIRKPPPTRIQTPARSAHRLVAILTLLAQPPNFYTKCTLIVFFKVNAMLIQLSHHPHVTKTSFSTSGQSM
jgi:hypothetical protein